MTVGLQAERDAWRRRLETLAPGVEIEIVARTGSTNSDLLERLRADEAGHDGRVVVRRSIESRAFAAVAAAGASTRPVSAAPWRPILRIAEEQIAGRGRHGRSWQARPGASLTFSLAWRLSAADLSGLSLAVGVLLADALEPPRAGAAARIGVKWPNDLWLLDAPGRGRKLGGVLIETVPSGGQRVAVIGVGLNVVSGQIDAVDLSSGCASVDELDAGAGVATVLERLLPALLSGLPRFEARGLAPFLDGFARRDLLAGHLVETIGANPVLGTAAGLDPDGALRVRSADAHVHRIVSGEVSVRLQAPPGRGAAR